MVSISMTTKRENMTYADNSPLLKESRKPPLKLVKYHDYGVRKLQKRLKNNQSSIA